MQFTGGVRDGVFQVYGGNLLKSKAREIFMKPRESSLDHGLAVWDATPHTMPDCHQHDDVEVNFLERGAMTYLHSGHLVQLTESQLVLFWAGRPHQVVTLDGPPHYRGLTVPLGWFLSWGVPEILGKPLLEGELVFPPAAAEVMGFSTLTDRWIEDLWNDSGEYRKAMLLEIEAWFRRVALSLPTDDANHSHHSVSRRVLGEGVLEKVCEMARYIHEHYTDQVSVPEIAAAVNLHPNYAVQLFRERTGSTIVDFVTMQRLGHAQLRLATSESQVLDIAFESGFGSASRFYAVFKDKLHMTPSEYREMVRKPREIP